VTTSTSDRARRGAKRRAPAAPPAAARRVARPAPLAEIDPALGARATLVLGVAAALLVALVTAAAFDPSMRWWGADSLRFAPAWIGWAPWMLVLLAFVPPLARRVVPALAALGDGLAAGEFRATGALAALAILIVALLPDRLWLIGDFLLRLGCTRGQIPVEIVFPQALPLDLFLHHHVPVAIARAHLADPNAWERLLGAIEAGLLVPASAELARRLGFRGVPAAACTLLVVFSGALGLFTGYGKSFVELTLVTVVAAGAALRVVREGEGAWPLAAMLVIGILLHRSALALFALLAVAVWAWPKTPAAREPGRRFATLAAFAAPVIAALVCAPILIASMQVTDVRHLAPTGLSPGAIFGAAFAPAHLADVVNLVAMSAPLALAAPFLAVALAAPLRARGAESLVLLALAVPALLVLFFVHPRQGDFRDTDVFAPSLASLAVVAAALAGEALRGAPSRAWLALPVILFGAFTTLRSLAIAADLDRGSARVRAYLTGPPRRPDEERALLWAYLAERMIGAHRPADAAPAFAEAAALAPSPRILMEWALAEEDRKGYAAAQGIYRRAAERAPGFTEAWLGLAGVSIELRDWPSADAALDHAARLEPDRVEIASMRHAIAERRAAEPAP